MRLLFVIPKVGSYLAFLRELGMSLVGNGVEVHIACSPDKLWTGNASPEDDGVRMHGVNFPRGMNPVAHLRAAQELNRLVAEVKPDIIHAHFSAAIFTTAIACNSRWPVTLATFHGVSFLAMTGWKAALLRTAETWAARRFDAVWVLTDDDRDGLRAAARGAKVHRLPGFGMGCDLDKFAPVSEARKTALRANLGIEPENVVFAFVGRFTDFKGFGLAARAFLRIATAGSRVRFLLIGERDPLHPTGLTAAEEQALRNSPQVIDAGFRYDVERCLAAADVMIFPSRREGMPVCLMEALALGIPVITCDTRGCRDVVRDGLDGVVLGDRTVDKFAAAMKQLADSPDVRRRMSNHALADRDRFSRRHFVREQQEIYAECARPTKA